MIGPHDGVGKIKSMIFKCRYLREFINAKKLAIMEEHKLPMRNPTDVSVYSRFLYINDASQGSIFKFPISNLSDFEEIPIPITHPWGLLVDDDSVYVTDDIEQTINKLSIDSFKIEQTRKIPKSDMHGISSFNNDLIAINDWVSKSIFLLRKDLSIPVTSTVNNIVLGLPDIAGLYISQTDGKIFVTDSTLSMIILVKNNHKVFYKGIRGHLHGIVQVEDKKFFLIERNSRKIFTIGVE